MSIGDGFEEETRARAVDARLLRRLWAFIVPQKRLLALSVLLLPAVTGFELAQPYLLKLAIDRHIVPRAPAGLGGLALAYLGLLVGEFVARYAQVITMQEAGQKVCLDLRSTLFHHVERLPMGFFERTPRGRILTRLTSDVEQVNEMFAAGVVALVADLVTLVGIMAVMLALDARLTGLTFLILPPLAGFALLMRRRLRDTFRKIREEMARLASYLQEAVSGMSVIQLFLRESRSAGEFGRLNERFRDTNLRAIRYDAMLFAIVEMAGSIAAAGILWVGAHGILGGLLTFGTLVAFLQYIDKFFIPVRDVAAKYAVMQSAMAGCERIFSLLDQPLETDAGGRSPAAGPLLASRPRRPAVSFESVSFAYAQGGDVLHEVGFSVGPGEKVAIVGATGGGKTTLIKLLLGFYPLERGCIRIDGQDIRTIPLAELRRKVGVVFQDVFLFAGTVAENIHLGEGSIGPERMLEAARAARLDERVARLPSGYDSRVTERGVNFSAGERQLVSFARALAFDPPILVLDEATSAVDPATEVLVQEALEALLERRTSLIIAHRLSTIRRADRIIVLHKGRVREVGAHEELMGLSDGIYRRLYNLQTQGRI